MDRNLSSYARVIGEEWKARSRELADWAFERLVNRKDVWGQYTVPTAKELQESKRSYKALTLPQKKMRGQDMVTLEKLSRHFGSMRRNYLIGLHASSEANTSRWMAIDIDLHDADVIEAEDLARRNFVAAVGWWEVLQQRGYDPLLVDSNGRGGYHIWVLLAEPAPTPDVFAYLRLLTSDWKARNLDAAPETFPKNAHRSGDKLGAWLRLPGLHHTHDHYAKIWSGEPWLDDPWLAGQDAIDALLGAIPGPPLPITSDEDLEEAELKRKRGKPKLRPQFKSAANKSGKRPVICVDLDGVLAKYDGWRGKAIIGEPVDGAIEFSRSLAEYADMIVWSARVRTAADAKLIRKWLEESGIVYVDVFTGKGKPPAHAYVDDRAVVCEPQKQGPGAFLAAEERIRALVE